MLISIKKDIFDKKTTDQLNQSLKLIEDKVESFTPTNLESEVSEYSVKVENAIDNYSKSFGKVIVIFARCNPNNSISIDSNIAPKEIIRVQAFSEVEDDDTMYSAIINTDGTITFSGYTTDTTSLVFYANYILPNNPYEKANSK